MIGQFSFCSRSGEKNVQRLSYARSSYPRGVTNTLIEYFSFTVEEMTWEETAGAASAGEDNAIFLGES